MGAYQLIFGSHSDSGAMLCTRAGLEVSQRRQGRHLWKSALRLSCHPNFMLTPGEADETSWWVRLLGRMRESR